MEKAKGKGRSRLNGRDPPTRERKGGKKGGREKDGTSDDVEVLGRKVGYLFPSHSGQKEGGKRRGEEGERKKPGG